MMRRFLDSKLVVLLFVTLFAQSSLQLGSACCSAACADCDDHFTAGSNIQTSGSMVEKEHRSEEHDANAHGGACPGYTCPCHQYPAQVAAFLHRNIPPRLALLPISDTFHAHAVLHKIEHVPKINS